MKFQLEIRGQGIHLTHRLRVGVTLLGRKHQPIDPPDNLKVDIEITTGQLARPHVRFECDENACWLTDLGGEYGTKVNGGRLIAGTRIPLNSGDTLEFGWDYQATLIETSQIVQTAAKPRSETITRTEPPLPIEIKPADYSLPPGLSRHSIKLIRYLPEIYQPPAYFVIDNDDSKNEEQQEQQTYSKRQDLSERKYDSHENFISRFLALFESFLLPIEWTISNFDLFLNPLTSPDEFLPWLKGWFSLTTDATWSIQQQRRLLMEADQLFAMRGTAMALRRVLAIYLDDETQIPTKLDDKLAEEKDGKLVEIFENNAEPHKYEFYLRLHRPVGRKIDEKVVDLLIDIFRPAHTNCSKIVWD